MPPWKPIAGARFRDERTLTDQQIATLAKWADNGKPAGNPKDAPPPRQFADGWQLGTPDLIVTMEDDFQLGPTGPDHFRWLAFPTNLTEDRYVTAVEVKPGNARTVHHRVRSMTTPGGRRKTKEGEKKRRGPPTDRDRGPGSPGVRGPGRARGGHPRPMGQPPQGQPGPDGQRRPMGAFGL